MAFKLSIWFLFLVILICGNLGKCTTLFEDDRLMLGDQVFDIVNNSLPCTLIAKDKGILDDIENGIEKGNKLMKYMFTFDGYETNPMEENITIAYKGDHWTLSTTTQGKTLLALAFDYGPLSLLTLTFGVENLNITLEDNPKGCLRHLDEKRKVEAILVSGMRSFQKPDHPVTLNKKHNLCHQVIQKNGGYAFFTYQCCAALDNGLTAKCSINKKNVWLATIEICIIVIKVLAFISVVAVAPDMFLSSYNKSKQVPYEIHRKAPLEKFVRFLCLDPKKKVTIKSRKKSNTTNRKRETTVSGAVQNESIDCRVAIDLRKEPKKGFSNCKEFIRTNLFGQNDCTLKVKINKYKIAVEYKRLQGENEIPVGFLRSISRAIFLCGLRETDPFRICCQKSILSPRFDSIRWIDCCIPLGGILIVIFAPFPFYIRLLFFYLFENDEVLYQHQIAKHLGLHMDPVSFDLMDVLLPVHPLCIIIYGLYISTLVVIGLLALTGDMRKLQNILFKTLSDVNNISKVDIAKGLLKKLLYPFETCGIFGCLIYPFFFLTVVPFMLIGHVLFVVPLIHFNIKLITNSKIFILGTNISCKKSKCFGKFKGLRKVVVEAIPILEREPGSGDQHMAAVGKREIPMEVSRFRRICRAIGIVLLMLTTVGLSILAGECIGFAAEVLFFTMMGIMANAGVYLQYVSLILLIAVYSHSCFSSVYKRYMKLNHSIFSEIKGTLRNDIEAVTQRKAEEQQNTAFKGSSYTDALNKSPEKTGPDIENIGDEQIDPNHANDSETENVNSLMENTDENKLQEDKNINKTSDTHPHEDDLCPEKHWDLDDVLFFVDKNDTPRIPTKLFHRVCAIQVDGSPGPVHLAMLESLHHFLYMLFFLGFVFIAISSFGAIYQINSTNRMLATVVGGVVPLLMRTFLKPEVGDVTLNSVSFQNKLNEEFHNLEEKWLISDLPMMKDDEGDISGNEHLDLVIIHNEPPENESEV